MWPVPGVVGIRVVSHGIGGLSPEDQVRINRLPSILGRDVLQRLVALHLEFAAGKVALHTP